MNDDEEEDEDKWMKIRRLMVRRMAMMSPDSDFYHLDERSQYHAYRGYRLSEYSLVRVVDGKEASSPEEVRTY